MKLHLGKRLRQQVAKHEAWWAENRPAAPDLFARAEQATASEFVRGEREATVELGGEISGPTRPEPKVFKPLRGAVVPSRTEAEKAENDVNKLKAIANAAVVELTSDLEFLLSLTGPEPSFTGGETSVPFPGDRDP